MNDILKHWIGSGFRAVLLLSMLWLAAACGSSGDGVDRDAAVGQLRLPLTTTAWERTYRLRGVFVIRAGTAPDAPTVTALSTDNDPDATVLSSTLPSGTYSVFLSEGWRMELAVDGGWTTVSAEMTGNNPLTATVTQGGTTQVTFRFLVHAAAAENGGELTIGIDVQKESRCGNRVVEPAETCDDGTKNGAVGRCDSSCRFVCVGACPLRVNPNAPVGGSGVSWGDALSDIQAAIDQQSALGGGAVWVVGGDFTPASEGGRPLLTLRSNVHLLGGFQGTETSRDERSESAPLTVVRDPRPVTETPVYALESIGQDGVIVDRLHVISESAPLHLEGGTQLLFQGVTLEGRGTYPPTDVSSTEVRFDRSYLMSRWHIVNSQVAFVDSQFGGASYSEVSTDDSRVLLERVITEFPLSFGNGSEALVKETSLRGAYDRGGVMIVSSASTVPSTATLMDSEVLVGGTQSPILGGSLLVWSSSFVNMRSGWAGGVASASAAIESYELEVALSTFFNNSCQESSHGPCWEDVLTNSTSLVHNTLFVQTGLPSIGPPEDQRLPSPIQGAPRVIGNCITSARDQFLVDQGQVLAVQHPCLDGGDAAELEASRQRLLARVAPFLNAPFRVDVSRYQSPDWWRTATVLDAQCSDEAAPDPGRHYRIDCALRISEPVIGCSGDPWPTNASFEILTGDPELAEPGQVPSFAQNVSANGRVVVGESLSASNPSGSLYVPAVWENGSIRLLKGMSQNPIPQSLDCDGSAAFISNATLPEFAPVRWTRDAVTTLPILPDQIWVVASSASGATLVGTRFFSTGDVRGEAVRWQNDLLSPLPLSGSTSAFGVSADGGTVFGVRPYGCNDNCVQTVFRWTEAEGEQALFSGAASFAVSSDGSTAAANVDGTLHSVVLWNQSRGSRVIDCPVESCFVYDLSSRGRVLLLDAFVSGPYITSESSWVWTLRHGARELRSLLVQHGATIPDNLQLIAPRMSDDARVFVGRVIDETGNERAFRASLPRAAYD